MCYHASHLPGPFSRYLPPSCGDPAGSSPENLFSFLLRRCLTFPKLAPKVALRFPLLAFWEDSCPESPTLSCNGLSLLCLFARCSLTADYLGGTSVSLPATLSWWVYPPGAAWPTRRAPPALQAPASLFSPCPQLRGAAPHTKLLSSNSDSTGWWPLLCYFLFHCLLSFLLSSPCSLRSCLLKSHL